MPSDALVADTPLFYKSNHAHSPRDVLGTLPRLLGLEAIVSEDCVRRDLRRIEADEVQNRLRRHLDQTCHSFLDTKWVLDIDVTIKPIRGRREGASLGRNPRKPGRPSHTYWIAILRLCLDVEVHPGNRSAAGTALPVCGR